MPETNPTPIPPSDELAVGRLFRRFYQILTLLFCLFLVVRTTFVEPHGVPTGSMAATIYGHHRECPCPRCEYSVVVGVNADEELPAAFCPNCGLQKIPVGASETISGDRVLVDRFTFRTRPPRRWEMAVFHPTDDSKIPYVKRVVGLPNEAISIRGGDVFANGAIVKKSPEMVREMRIPIFDIDHIPQPMGWAARFEPGLIVSNKLPRAPTPESAESIESILRGGEIHLNGVDVAKVGVGYRHRNLDTGKDETIRDELAYNGVRGAPQPVGDFLVECEVEIVSGAGILAFHLTDGADGVRFDLGIGEAFETRVEPDAGIAPVKYSTRLTVRKKVALAFAVVDRRAWLKIDGELAGAPLDLPAATGKRGTNRPLQLQAEGISAVIRHLKLYRDVHYREEGENGVTAPYQLASTEYFVLGDNSAASEDSRMWKKPGVPEGDFLGKPFFVHQPLRCTRWLINGKEQRLQTVDWDRLRLLR